MNKEIEVKETFWWVDRIAAMGSDPYCYTDAYHQGNITDDQLKQVMFENALMMAEDERKHAEKYYDIILKLCVEIANYWQSLMYAKLSVTRPIERNKIEQVISQIQKLALDTTIKDYLQTELLKRLK